MFPPEPLALTAWFRVLKMLMNIWKHTISLLKPPRGSFSCSKWFPVFLFLLASSDVWRALRLKIGVFLADSWLGMGRMLRKGRKGWLMAMYVYTVYTFTFIYRLYLHLRLCDFVLRERLTAVEAWSAYHTIFRYPMLLIDADTTVWDGPMGRNPSRKPAHNLPILRNSTKAHWQQCAFDSSQSLQRVGDSKKHRTIQTESANELWVWHVYRANSQKNMTSL